MFNKKKEDKYYWGDDVEKDYLILSELSDRELLIFMIKNQQRFKKDLMEVIKKYRKEEEK